MIHIKNEKLVFVVQKIGVCSVELTSNAFRIKAKSKINQIFIFKIKIKIYI